MAKMARERKLQERREMKQEKKRAAREAKAGGSVVSDEELQEDTDPAE